MTNQLTVFNTDVIPVRKTGDEVFKKRCRAMGITEDLELLRIVGRLMQHRDFKDFYVEVCEMKVESDMERLKKLRVAVGVFEDKFGIRPITYLKDDIDCEIVLKMRNPNNTGRLEKRYQKKLVNRFAEVFPHYTYVGQEKTMDELGRIDILALDKETGRDVIIELKTGAKNPNKQLLAYGSRYTNPILIGITEKELPERKKRKGIQYFTYSQLGVTLHTNENS